MTGNGGRYFEIDGILEQLTKRWSGRSVEVTEHMDALAAEFLERYGREPTQVELRRAVVRSRRRKTVTAKTGLRHYCRGVAALHDITPASLAELRRTGRPRTDAQARAIVAAELLGPDGLTSEQATFTGQRPAGGRVPPRRRALRRRPGGAAGPRSAAQRRAPPHR